MDYIFAAAKRSDTPEILKLYQRLIGTRGCNWYGDCPNRERVEHDIDDDSLYVVTDKKYNIIAVAALEQDTDADTQAWQSKIRATCAGSECQTTIKRMILRDC